MVRVHEAVGSNPATRTIVGAKSALLRRLFMSMTKKTSSARSLAPPLQIEPTPLGFDLVFLFREPVAFYCVNLIMLLYRNVQLSLFGSLYVEGRVPYTGGSI